MAFDRTFSALLASQAQQSSASHFAPQSGDSGSNSGVSPGSSMSGLSSSSSQSLHLPSHPGSSALSHSSVSSTSSGDFEDALNAELFTLHNDTRGLSAAGFDLNLERFPSAGMGLSGAYKDASAQHAGQQGQQSNNYGNSRW